MAFNIQVELTGLEDVFARLEALKRGMRNPIIRGALKKATKPILDNAIANLTPGHGLESGTTKKALGRKTKTYASTGTIVVIIGARSGFKQKVTISPDRVYRQIGGRRGSKGVRGVFGRTVKIRPSSNPKFQALLNVDRNPVKTAHLTELGIGPRGKRDAKPFLRPAMTAQQAVATEIFRREVEAALEAMGY